MTNVMHKFFSMRIEKNLCITLVVYQESCRCQFMVLEQEMALVIILAVIAHHTPNINKLISLLGLTWDFRQTQYLLLREFFVPVRPKPNQCFVFGTRAS
jgi:hypothetical protein